MTWRLRERATGQLLDEPSAAGVGIVTNGILSASYYSTTMTGMIVYTMEEDGLRLVGKRVIAGSDGKVHSETLMKISGHPPLPPIQRGIP